MVHGGGNLHVETAGELHADTNVLTRLDGRDWQADGYEVGQRVQLEGETFTREILGFADADGSLKPADAFATWGRGSAMVLSGGDHAIFLTDRISLGFLVAAALFVLGSLAMTLRESIRRGRAAAPG